MSWHCKATGAYAQGSTECTENAQEIYSYLSARGWSLNAVCGVLGNFWAESGLNPWRWQNDVVQPTTNSPWWSIGYGLAQFTEAGTYINLAVAKAQPQYGPNFSNKDGKVTDGIAQLYVINTDARGGYIKTSSYNLTFAEFKRSTESPSYLAIAWLANYERPAEITEEVKNYRGGLADYFYELLTGSTPTPPTGEYTVTVYSEGQGSAIAIPTSGKEGTRVQLYKRAVTGYKFLGWSVESGGVTISRADAFTIGTEDVIIKARFSGETPPEPPPEPSTKRKTKMIYYIPWWRKYGL